MICSDNPVRDAEAYAYAMAHINDGRESIECDYCHGPVYKADDEHYGDDYYEVNGMVICDNCIRQYLKEIKKECM